MSERDLGEAQAEADRYLKAWLGSLRPEEAVYVVAVLLNRAAVEMHRLARLEAAERKGSAEWGRWAALQNAARSLVLQSSTARDLAAQLVGRER